MIKVMLVDDQNLVRKGVRSLLELSEEIDVIAEAPDGAEAVRMIPDVGPDVVLLDMRMPGMNGVEVLREARTLAPDTVRILLTSHADREHIIEAINDGKIYRFVAKPWDDDSLAALVEEAMGAHDHARAARRNQHIGRDVARIRSLFGERTPAAMMLPL